MTDRYFYAIRLVRAAIAHGQYLDGVAVFCRDLPELNSYGDNQSVTNPLKGTPA